MTQRNGQPSPLLDRYDIRAGIHFPPDTSAPSIYCRQWETEAKQDPVLAAIAAPGDAREDFETLTRKISPRLLQLDLGVHKEYGSVLEIGCGYGRVPLYLSREKGLACRRYLGVDISETMLRHLQRYRRQFDFLPGAEFVLICQSAEQLPLEDESVDLVISSAVFLHMGKGHVRRTLAEAARVLKPGGSFLFETSFPNKLCPANLPPPAEIEAESQAGRP